MPRHDFRTPRLYVDHPLAAGVKLALDSSQTNYLRNVLRLRPGDQVLVFNTHDGEWRAALADGGKRALSLTVEAQSRAQTQPLDLHYWFAPLKHARLDYMVQKAVEMGVARLQPVLTQHGQVARLNLERMRANAIEAAEQCGILTLPEIVPPLALARVIAAHDPARLVVFCDEDAEVADPLAALARARPDPGAAAPPLAVLIGPEGGFAAAERVALIGLPQVVRLALGPRILRADTAAVAALALVQSVLGDWRCAGGPP
ncbi:MAG TPA: 16S rRNA (uracil(1498)-N(3))-methyltransferase [Xanthobacteraceae bacterium]